MSLIFAFSETTILDKDLHTFARKLNPHIKDEFEKDFGYHLKLEEYEINECLTEKYKTHRIEALLKKWMKKEKNPTKFNLKKLLKESEDIPNDFIDKEF